MRTIGRIARLELSTLFYSPIAWLVLIIFTFQTGIIYASILEIFESMQETGRHFTTMTNLIFASMGNPHGLFIDIQDNLYLYIPLLTMGLMSREIASGSVKLLLSSPVKIRQILLGKYLAMMVYGLGLIGILLLFLLCGGWIVPHLEVKLLVSDLLGLYLLICAYSAIGLYMSCLTSYQVVAAISTLAILAALNYMGELWQGVDLVRSLTWCLRLSGRTNQLMSGLINSRDLFYFLIVIVLFLGLSMMKLQDSRSLKPMTVKAVRYLLFIGCMLSMGYLSSRPGLTLYYDMTLNKRQTLSPGGQEIAGQIARSGQPLHIHNYVNLLDDNAWRDGNPNEKSRDEGFWERYQRFIPNLHTGYTWYYDTSVSRWIYKSNPSLDGKAIAKNMSHALDMDFSKVLSPAEIRRKIDLMPEENRFVRQLEWGGRKAFLRVFNDNTHVPSDQEILGALKTMLSHPARVAFLTGNNERDPNKRGDRDYYDLTQKLPVRDALINQGFEILTVSVDSMEIPQDIAALVIADPGSPFRPAQLEKIQRYIQAGGNLLIAGEPGRQEILNPLIAPLGVKMMDGVLIQTSKDFSPDFLQTFFAESSGRISSSFEGMWADSQKITMPGAVALKYSRNGEFNIDPLLITSENNTWNKMGVFKMDTGNVSFNPERGDDHQSQVVAVALTRQVGKKEQRMVITGDADFMSTGKMIQSNMETANAKTALEFFSWFARGEYPVRVYNEPAKDNWLAITRPGLGWVRLVFLGMVPGLLLAYGGWLLWKRKRK